MPIGAARANLSRVPSFIPDSVVDNFESVLYEEKGNTLSDYYQDVTNLSRSTSTVNEGNYALKVDPVGQKIHHISENGLPTYPSAGDTFRWNFYITQADQILDLAWAAKADDRNYLARLHANGSDVSICKDWSETTGSKLSTEPLNYSTNVWWECEVEWKKNGDMALRVFDENGSEQATVFATDTSYTDGGISWYTNSGGASAVGYYDNLRLV